MDTYDYSALLQAAKESDDVFDSDGEVIETEYADVLLSVTDCQHQAITHPYNMGEMLRIRAGPGSGKTYTMTARIAKLLQDGVNPREILVLSMANRSVDALRESLAAIVGENLAGALDVSTFHSFCSGLLDQYGEVHGVGGAKGRVFDTQSWATLAKLFRRKDACINKHHIEGDITVRQLENLLTNIARGSTTVQEGARQHNINPKYVEALVAHLSENGLMRYEDLVGRALQMMESSKNDYLADPERLPTRLLGRVAGYKAIFVDEFQDIYPLLMTVVHLVVTYPVIGTEGTNRHLTVAGDPNQSVYEFLGTSLRVIDSLSEQFPRMFILDIYLNESFRCTQPILDAAVACCTATGNTLSKLHSHRSGAIKPTLLPFSDSQTERIFIADEIARLICCLGGLVQLKDIAVLTRTNGEAVAMQKVLKDRHGFVSHKISQGNIWLKSNLQIVRDILAVISGGPGASLSLLSLLPILDKNKFASFRTSRIFNLSIDAADANNPTFLEDYLFTELEKIAVGDKGSKVYSVYKNQKESLERLANFLNQVQRDREFLQQQDHCAPVDVTNCLARFAKLPGIQEHLQANSVGKEGSANEMLHSFNNSLHASYERYFQSSECKNMPFVSYFVKTCDNEVPPARDNVVKVSTIHSAKGLEFPIVFVAGGERAHWNKLLEEQPEEVSDEVKMANPNSRLLYVALTRARDLLYLGCAKASNHFLKVTKNRFSFQIPSLDSISVPTADSASGTSQPDTSSEVASRLVRQAESTPNTSLSEQLEQLMLDSGSLPSPVQAEGLEQLLARDLKREIPLAGKKQIGTNLFTRFSKFNTMHDVHAAMAHARTRTLCLRKIRNALTPQVKSSSQSALVGIMRDTRALRKVAR